MHAKRLQTYEVEAEERNDTSDRWRIRVHEHGYDQS